MTKAELRLFPQHFKIVGPTILITMVQTILSNKETANEQIKYQLEDLFVDWYVICSVSGERIRLCDLKYWDVEKQEVYARPELVPALGWYVTLPVVADG